MAKIDCTFHRANNHNIEVHSSMGDFPIMRLEHDYEGWKSAGFVGEDKKPIYKVTSMCDQMVNLLNVYNEAGLLIEPVFNHIINAYRPFIRNYMIHSMIVKRVNETKNPEGWLDA